MRTSMILLSLMMTAAATAQPIYPTSPDWVSANPGVSTGAAFADIDGDGRLDLIVADGNDIDPGPLNIYHNVDGTFATAASWTSTDTAYNGHLDVADVNGDGWIDVAVSHLGTFGVQDAVAKVYLNSEGVLSSTPDWEAAIEGNAFGVAFGDANGDGRPDLAVATGWAYGTPHLDENLIFMNVGGALETSPSWQSDDTFDHQGVLWADADDDGWLDVVMIGANCETRVYRNLGGTIETSASWTTSDSSSQDGIMLACGDVTGDGVLDLLATDNTQLGGNGRFKLYPGIEDGLFQTSYTWSYYEGYGSAVALADVNADGMLDLATGAWWDRTRLFYNTGTGFGGSPSWSSAVTSVIEKIVFGDVDPPCDVERRSYDRFAADGDRSLFRLSRQQIQGIEMVLRDGVQLTPDQYTWSRERGWISVDAPPSDALVVVYSHAGAIDMAVSNWDGSIGNYLYYSSLIEDCNGNGTPDGCDINGGASEDINANGLPDECECPADCAEPGDGLVDVNDLLALLGDWGGGWVAGDLNADGSVDVDDLLILLAAWGPCP
jgi:hypothetical protein